MNLFFSTFKQAMDNMGKVRMELAHKYYALAEVQPDLKVDLFSSDTREIDLNRIQRVSVFNTNRDGRQCVATIDGRKMQPRSVTPQQWQRVMVAEDKTEYKRHLAATLFADVLQKGQSQEEHAGEKQEKEAARRQGEAATQERTEDKEKEEAVSPQRKAWDEVRAKHPDALQLVRTGDNYRLYNEDAVRGAEILGLALKERNGIKEGFTTSAEFPYRQLDSCLPKLVRAGERVVIRDMEAQEERQAEQETHRGIHR